MNSASPTASKSPFPHTFQGETFVYVPGNARRHEAARKAARGVSKCESHGTHTSENRHGENICAYCGEVSK